MHYLRVQRDHELKAHQKRFRLRGLRRKTTVSLVETDEETYARGVRVKKVAGSGHVLPEAGVAPAPRSRIESYAITHRVRAGTQQVPKDLRAFGQAEGLMPKIIPPRSKVKQKQAPSSRTGVVASTNPAGDEMTVAALKNALHRFRRTGEIPVIQNLEQVDSFSQARSQLLLELTGKRGAPMRRSLLRMMDKVEKEAFATSVSAPLPQAAATAAAAPQFLLTHRQMHRKTPRKSKVKPQPKERLVGIEENPGPVEHNENGEDITMALRQIRADARFTRPIVITAEGAPDDPGWAQRACVNFFIDCLKEFFESGGLAPAVFAINLYILGRYAFIALHGNDPDLILVQHLFEWKMRLVGIELNPGPQGSAPKAAASGDPQEVQGQTATQYADSTGASTKASRHRTKLDRQFALEIHRADEAQRAAEKQQADQAKRQAAEDARVGAEAVRRNEADKARAQRTAEKVETLSAQAGKKIAWTRPGKKRPASCPDSISIIEKQIAHEAQKEAGEKDAKEEKQSDEEKAAAEALLKKQWEAKRDAQLEQGMAAFKGLPKHLCWHNCLPGRWEAPLCAVERKFRNLTVYPAAHKATKARFLHVRNTSSWEMEDGKLKSEKLILETPQQADQPRAPGNYYVATYRLRTRSYGFNGDVKNVEECEISFCVEQLALARVKAIATLEFEKTIVRVVEFRKQFCGFPNPLYDERTYGRLGHQLFAALLMVDDSLSRQTLDMMTDAGVKAACDMVRKRVMTNPGDEPMAAGTYVRGYETSFSEVFPAHWPGAVQRVRDGLQTARESAQQFFDECTTEGCRFTQVHIVDPLRRANGYCRQSYVSIKDCLPSFPNPFSQTNAMIGAMKRIMLRPCVPTDPEDMVHRRELVAEVLIERAAEAASDERVEQILMRSEEMVAKHTEWSPLQKDDFMKGARGLCDAVVAGATALDEYIEKQVHILKVGLFGKAEQYDKEKIKTVRNILAPSHESRGFLYGLFSSAEHAFFECMKGHCMKFMRPDEATRMLKEAADGFTAWFDNDWVNYEGQVKDFMRRKEGEVLAAFSPRELRKAVQKVSDVLSILPTMFTSFFFTAYIAAIRRSGEYQTSVGNFITNFIGSFAAVSRALQIPIGKLKEWLRSYSRPWFFEGDDGLMAIPHGSGPALEAAFEAHGCRVESKEQASWMDANFCGRTVREVWEGGVQHLQIVKDPYQVLSKLTHWIGCDQSSSRHDPDMLISRALGLFRDNADTPLAGPAIKAILLRHHKRAVEMLTALKEKAGEKVLDASVEAGFQLVRAAKGVYRFAKRTYGKTAIPREALMNLAKSLSPTHRGDDLTLEALERLQKDVQMLSEAMMEDSNPNGTEKKNPFMGIKAETARIYSLRYGFWAGRISSDAKITMEEFRRINGTPEAAAAAAADVAATSGTPYTADQLEQDGKKIFEHFLWGEGELDLHVFSAIRDAARGAREMVVLKFEGLRERANASVEALVAKASIAKAKGMSAWAVSKTGVVASVQGVGAIAVSWTSIAMGVSPWLLLCYPLVAALMVGISLQFMALVAYFMMGGLVAWEKLRKAAGLFFVAIMVVSLTAWAYAVRRVLGGPAGLFRALRGSSPAEGLKATINAVAGDSKPAAAAAASPAKAPSAISRCATRVGCFLVNWGLTQK